jgi:hypothetical protein
VAVIAGIAAGDVVVRLAGGGGAVVAGEAGAGDTAVIESYRGPGRGRVAIIAGIPARNVVGRPAFGNCAIVTTCTGTDYRSVVDPRDNLPREGIVTIGAVVRGSEMIDRFLAGWYSRGKCVAGNTTVWRSLEYAVQMTILALGLYMTANQRKSRGKVVEVAGSGRARIGIARQARDDNREKRSKQPSGEMGSRRLHDSCSW